MSTRVLVHGCGQDAHFWDELVPHLRGPTLAVSLPGRAGTGGRACTSAAEAARWLCDELAARGIDDAIVTGHSFGGAIAMEAVRLDPSRFAGLALVNSGARLRVAPAILAAVDEAVRTGVPADLTAWSWRRGSDPALVERIERHARDIPVQTTRADWYATNAYDRLGQLGDLRLPTVVVTGADDPLTPPKYAHYLAEHIAGARVHVVPAASHMLPAENPAALAAAL